MMRQNIYYELNLVDKNFHQWPSESFTFTFLFNNFPHFQMPSFRQKSAFFFLPSISQFFPFILHAFLSLFFISFTNGQAPFQSPECKKAAEECENATDCVHRLAVLQSACVTNTCQPQCREAALNLYQNREGRALLRTDASCVPGRYELEKCGFLPNKSPKHCSLAKLICETDLQCNAKWEVFMSECEADTNSNDLRRCPDKCRRHLNATLATQHGAAFGTCTCTDKEDGRCTQLRDLTIHSCLGQGLPEDEEGPLARPGTIGGEASREEGDDLDLNGIGQPSANPPVHSQSDVPDGAIGQGNSLGWMVLLPSILLAVIAALAVR